MVLESITGFDGVTISEFSLYSSLCISSISPRAQEFTKIFLYWVWHLSVEKIIQPLTSSTFSLSCIGYLPFAPPNLFSTHLYPALCHGYLNSMGFVKELICSLTSFWVYGSSDKRISRKEERLEYLFSRLPTWRLAEYWLHPSEKFHSLP